MAQIWDILPENMGSVIGKNLGGGLAAGLNQYTQNKMAEMSQAKQQNKLAQALQYLPGVNSQLAQGLSVLPESVLQTVLKQTLQGPENEAYASALGQILGNAPEPQQQLMQPSTAEIGQSQPISGQPQVEQVSQSGLRGTPLRIPPRLSAEKATKLADLALKKQEAELKRQEAAKSRELKRELAQQKAEQAERHFERKIGVEEQREINKETLPFYNKVNDQAEGATDDIRRLEKMAKLVQAGNLPNAKLASLFKFAEKWGLDFTSALGADAEEFAKTSTDFLKNVKSYFGSQLTQGEVEQFLKTVPTLIQSPEGQARIINNLMIVAEAIQAKQVLMNEIIKENRGMRPRDLQYQTKKRLDPVLKNIAKQWDVGGEKRINAPEPVGFIRGLFQEHNKNVMDTLKKVIPGL